VIGLGVKLWKGMLVEQRDGTVEPDYFQFYLKTGGAPHTPHNVSGAGHEAHFEASSQGFVYVGTLKKYSPTPVRVEVHDSEPGSPSEEWQHVVEVSLPGDGVIEVLSWPGEVAFSAPTPVGPLRLRAMWAGLLPDLTEGLPEEGNSDERLLFQLWPAPPAGRKVLRCWSEWDLPPLNETAPDGRRQIEGQAEVVDLLKQCIPLPVILIRMPPDQPPVPMPGGPSGVCSGIWGDLRDGTWWADGYDVRRVLRAVSDEEVRNLVRDADQPPQTWPHPRLPDPRWDAMLRRIGFGAPEPG
jgi:hypothetical protein